MAQLQTFTGGGLGVDATADESKYGDFDNLKTI